MKSQDIDISLDEALRRAPKWLHRKILHSIELLQKAEKLALKYDAEDGFFLAFSAGKDSQALYHVAKLAGVKFKAHINWTSVDPPQVVRFKRREYPDVVEQRPQWSIYDRAVHRGILPSMRIRWCCADFKETAGAGKVTLIGIRKEESTRRAKRKEVEVSNRQFAGTIEEFATWQETKIKEKEEKLLRKMAKEGKKVNEDEFSLQKDNEIRCINGKDSILISPIFEWTEKDVWAFLNDVIRAKHCELYDQGYKRIGCILCPMSQRRQKLRELKDFPHVKHKWIEAIKAIRAGGVSQGECTVPTMSDHQWKWDDGELPPTAQDCRRLHLVEHPSQRDNQECQRNAPKLGTELPPPNGKPSGSTGTERQWESDGQQCSCSGTTFGHRYGRAFYNQFPPPQQTEDVEATAVAGASKYCQLRGHWSRKTNSGIWSGVFRQPLR